METILIEYLKKNNQHNKRQIARDLNISYQYVILLFQRLKDTGQLEEIKSYKINQKCPYTEI